MEIIVTRHRLSTAFKSYLWRVVRCIFISMETKKQKDRRILYPTKPRTSFRYDGRNYRCILDSANTFYSQSASCLLSFSFLWWSLLPIYLYIIKTTNIILKLQPKKVGILAKYFVEIGICVDHNIRAREREIF